MGGYRIPGQTCRVRKLFEIDEGTLALTCTPSPGVIGTVPYREATELHECIKILGEGNAAYCRREILGIPESSSSALNSKSLWVGGVEVLFVPDRFLDDPEITESGVTRPRLNYIKPAFRPAGGRVVWYTGPKKIRLIIETIYKPGLDPNATAAYGRGTTSQDRAAGNTSLAFHEKCHREDMVQYLKDHSFPRFGGRTGLAVSRFKQAIADWLDALNVYLKDMRRSSEIDTDCASGGITIDQYYRSKGINRAGVCPVK